MRAERSVWGWGLEGAGPSPDQQRGIAQALRVRYGLEPLDRRRWQPGSALTLTQTVEQLERMNTALTELHHELLPGQPKKFAILAEGPLEDIRRLQAEIEQLTAQIAAAAPAAA